MKRKRERVIGKRGGSKLRLYLSYRFVSNWSMLQRPTHAGDSHLPLNHMAIAGHVRVQRSPTHTISLKVIQCREEL